MSLLDRLTARAAAPVDGAALAVFRVMFGAVMVVDFARFFLAGWIDAYFLDPAFLFTYPGFSWVTPLPRPAMFVVFGALLVASVGVMVGAWYRVSAWALVVGHGYVTLLAATHYLNHAYLLQLVAVLMACVPAADTLSWDARRRPQGARAWVPAWAPWIFKAQFGVVYVYGGIAKVNRDWLAGEPIRMWLRHRAKTAPAPIGEWLASEWAVGFFVQGGLWFDLLVAPALLWRRTRWLAVTVSVGFHLTNAFLFNIGVFPWFMLAATTLFLDPDWPRRLPVLGPVFDRWLGPVPSDVAAPTQRVRRVVLAIGAWLLLHLLLPLRHHLYPGDVAWTEEGHYLAWRMKLRSKGGSATFVVRDPDSGRVWRVDPADELNPWQVRKMRGKPDLVLQYAHHLGERWQQEHGVANVEVRAIVNISLNGRAARPLIDPSVDLMTRQISLWPADWITDAPPEPVRRPRPS